MSGRDQQPERAGSGSLSPAKQRLLELWKRGKGVTPSGEEIPPIAPVQGAMEAYPLSFGQEGLWFLERLMPGSAAYNFPLVARLDGALDVDSLEKALKGVVARHEILRARITSRDGIPTLRVESNVPVDLECIDLLTIPEDERDAERDRQLEEQIRKPFELDVGPLFRFALWRIGDESFLLMLLFHHTISDPRSLEIIGFETQAHYRAILAGETPDLPELQVQYPDYCLWQREWLRGEVLERQLGYWRSQLGDEPPILDLPTDRPRSSDTSFRGVTRAFALPELGPPTAELARLEGVTPYMVLLAAFEVLIQRYSGQDEFLIATPVNNRSRPELLPLVGYFVNTLALRADLTGNPSFRELLQRVRTMVLGSLAHQHLPFEQLISELQPGRGEDHFPLLRVWFAHNKTPPTTLEFSGLQSELLEPNRGIAQLDFSIDLFEAPEGLHGRVEYLTDLLDGETVDRMLDHYRNLIRAALGDPGARISRLPMLTDEERTRELNESSAAALHQPDLSTLHEVFERRVVESPQRVAVECGGRDLSYEELDRRANALASSLVENGVRAESVVGVALERSLETVVSLLGILKAGAAYLPIDLGHPQRHVEFMLSDQKVKQVVSRSALWNELGLQPGKIRLIDVDEAGDGITTLPVRRAGPQSLAYVLFTSGSTGTPKGVGCTHGAVLNLLADFSERCRLSGEDRCSWWTNLGFDVSVYEIFSALLSGATLSVVPEAMRLDAREVLGFLEARQISSAYIPPFFLKELADRCRELDAQIALRRMLVGVEPISLALLAEIRKSLPGLTLINGYGPTEATICCTLYEVSEAGAPGETAPIGGPVRGTRILLLDGELEPVARGVIGEVYVGGPGLARGYLGRPDLTADRFMPDPSAESTGERLYRTGDRARRRPDGSLQFVSRNDEQVKVRGYRIEPGEIEHTLKTHPGVEDAAVVARADSSGHKQLVAYVAPSSHEPLAQPEEARVLDSARVRAWRGVYDEFYRSDFSDEDSSINRQVWTSSYTREPLPAAEVLDHVDNASKRILALRPDRILEIGCGTGLMLFRLAPHVSHYCGTDISSVGLDYLGKHVEARRTELNDVRLLWQGAHEFDDLETESFDTVVLNEVIQLFPGVEYLMAVLRGAARVLRPGGHIFLGGVRSLPLLEAFHASVEFAAADADTDRAALEGRVREGLLSENELFLAPAFLTNLRSRLSEVTGTSVQLVRGSFENELTRFKYDVVLEVKGSRREARQVDWRGWIGETASLEQVRSILQNERPATLGIQGVANRRLFEESEVLKWLRSEIEYGSVDELRRSVVSRSFHGVDPEDLWRLGTSLGYYVCIDWHADGRSGDFDVAFVRRDLGGGEWQALRPPSSRGRASSLQASDPLREKLATLMVPQLRQFLRDRLPSFMIPTRFVLVHALPRTINGKLDRSRLPESPSQQDLAASYRAPRDSTEEALAEIWCGLLDLKRVGIDDNFFELGGDSILSIQVVARAARLGMQLTARDLFQHQNILELARAVGSTQVSIQAEQGLVLGEVPLTPVQCWFFEQDFAEPNHWNMPIMAELGVRPEPEHIRTAIQALLGHHDALRLRFVGEGASLRQLHGELGDLCFSRVDLSHVPDAELKHAIESEAGRWQETLDLAEGPTFRAVLLDLGESRHLRLLLIAHHLVVDGMSWRLLAEDLQLALLQLAGGREVELPAKTTSFQHWAHRSLEYARSEALSKELGYWVRAIPDHPVGIPVDREPRIASEADIYTHAATLDAEQTSALLREVPRAYGTRINDILLAALVDAFEPWTGSRSLLIELEGHGREHVVAEDVDLSRTVGWFTTVFPVWLDLERSSDPGPALQHVKEQLREIPNGGIGYGLLRYLSSDPEARAALGGQLRADVVFNYLGQFDQVALGGEAFGLAQERSGAAYSPRGHRSHLLEINALVTENALRVLWTFGRNVHDLETIERVASNFITSLQRIIDHCRTVEHRIYTPSDFPLAQVGQRTLDRLLSGESETEDLYPLSPMQEGMLFHSVLAPEAGVYVTQVTAALRGLNSGVLRAAWSQVIRCHPALRTGFAWEGLERPLQRVVREANPEWHEQDWRHLGPAEQEAQLKAALSQDRKEPFDLSRPPLMRLYLFRVGDRDWQFVWSHHHILLDGWSMVLVMSEVFAAYDALDSGRQPDMEAPTPYRDYIRWLAERDTSRAEEFWRERLAGVSSPTRLWVDRAPESLQDSQAVHEEVDLRLSIEETASLEAFARTNRITLNTIFQGAWARLLGAYAAEDQVLFGVAVSGRPPDLQGVESMAGVLINSLPMLVTLEGDKNLAKWMGSIHARQVEASEHAFPSLIDIQSWSDIPTGRALFDSVLVFENFPTDEALRRSGGSVEISDYDVISRAHFPLTVRVVPEERLWIRFTYDARRFDAETASSMLSQLRVLLRSAAEDPEQRVRDWQPISQEERSELLAHWEFEVCEGSRACVHHLVEDQAARTPAAIAVAAGEQTLSYGDLDRAANQLARHLRSLELGRDDRVAIAIDRGVDMVVGWLAILKTGAAYVPLDPAYPHQRLEMMAEDAGVAALVTTEAVLEHLPEISPTCVCLDRDQEAIASWPTNPLPRTARSGDLLCVLFTSGSTGRPKGAALTHEVIGWQHGDSSQLRGLRTLQFASPSFDVSLIEFSYALTSGGVLDIVPEAIRREPAELSRYLAERGIERCWLPVAMLRSLAEAGGFSGLREVIATGEQLRLSPSVRERFTRPDAPALINVYGPTETGVVAVERLEGSPETWSELPAIGRPIASIGVCIVDSDLKLVPRGVPGELLVRGLGVGRGYIGRADWSAERFIPDPHPNIPGGRAYRTGDLVRWLADGTLQYLGRVDQQVKVRGHRVELGEVEVALTAFAGVAEGTVMAHEDPAGGMRLAAYVVSNGELSIPELRDHLRSTLLEPMIPTAIMEIPELPIGPTGKLDRARLPKVQWRRSEGGVSYLAPRSVAERVVAALWSEVVGVERVGVRDSFFDLGGHSISAMRVVGRLREIFQVEVPLRRLFEAPSVESMVDELVMLWGDAEVVDEVARTVLEVAQLPDAEVAAQLEAEGSRI